MDGGRSVGDVERKGMRLKIRIKDEKKETKLGILHGPMMMVMCLTQKIKSM